MPWHGHKYTKYKKCSCVMVLICLKQHLNNIWSSNYAELKKSVYESVYGIITDDETSSIANLMENLLYGFLAIRWQEKWLFLVNKIKRVDCLIKGIAFKKT